MNRRTRIIGQSQHTTAHSRRQGGGGNRRRGDDNTRDRDNNSRRNGHSSNLAAGNSDDQSVHTHESNSPRLPLQHRSWEASENRDSQSEHDCYTTQFPDSDSKSFTTVFGRAAERRISLIDENIGLNNVPCHILSLPDDVLFLIFTFLQPADLCHVGCVCRRFYYLTAQDTVWLQHAKRTAVVKQFSTSQPCSAKELCRVAPNWKLGRFKEGFAVKHKHRLMPWVQTTDDALWFSMGSNISCFKLHSSGQVCEVKERCLRGLQEDATRFCVKKDKVVSGCRDGSVYGWDTSGNLMFCYKQVHGSDTQCVDFTDSVIITGSRDATCKILPVEAPSDGSDVILQSFDAGERVWSLKISPCESFFAAGLAGCQDDPPIVLWDIGSGECVGQLSVNHRRGAGVLDLRFESPHELLTCGYDTFIRLWDLRTQRCVNQWEEPHDSALYCLESDGNNAILVGTARHGMVRLWDKRKTEPVQAYYSNSRTSPVYSLAMDYRHLYLALDVGLNVMDFSCGKTDKATAASGLRDATKQDSSHLRHTFKK
ncbi:unnamed protein product [Candidula unifasciata]|uniref:F-box domain-containing protein n=1 Tax=Candidula unifasciata TaxID=100452 RepID=A0A8S3Z162_9EUPU|nr:unnamed protein product [Candidula unifasciata]